MKHTFGLDVLGCPHAGCKGRLALVAVLFDRDEVERLLEHLRFFTDPIPVQKDRGPPELWTEAYDFDRAAPQRGAEMHASARRAAHARSVLSASRRTC
jgi:hypothetical protein